MDKWWIKLSTQIQEHWIWKNHEFAYAWIDLLMMVNRSDNKVMVDNELITIKRGQRLTSICKLAERWGWSRNKTYKFILALEKDGMLKRTSTTHYTIITVVNYGKYQNKGTTVGTTKSTTVGTTTGQHLEHNIRRDKKDKEYKESAPLVSDETAALEDEEPPVPGAVRMPNGGWNYRPDLDWDDEDEE
jgi:hypothetical protein